MPYGPRLDSRLTHFKAGAISADHRRINWPLAFEAREPDSIDSLHHYGRGALATIRANSSMAYCQCGCRMSYLAAWGIIVARLNAELISGDGYRSPFIIRPINTRSRMGADIHTQGASASLHQGPCMSSRGPASALA